jgi:two-component system, NarL family, sensor kinase
MPIFRLFLFLGFLVFFLPQGRSQQLDSARRMMRSDPDRALEHLDESLAFAKKQNLDSLELEALVLRGELFMRTGRYDESREDLEHASVLAMNRNDSSMLGAIHGHFGGLAFFQSQFDRATEELLTAISYSTDEAFRARTFNNLGSIFERIGDDQKALTYFNKALELHRAADRDQLAASTLGNIGVILHKQEQFEEAIRHFRESVAMAASMQDTFALSIRWQNLGNSFLETTRFDSARVYFDRALAASRTLRDTFGMASIYNSRASLYERIQLPDSIISNRQQAYQLAMSIGDTTDMIQAQLALSRAYADQGDFQRAYRAQQLFHNLDSDVSEREQNDRLYELEARYQNVAKEKQLQEQAFALQREKREARTFRLVSLLIGLLALIISWALYSRWQQQKRLAIKEQEIHEARVVRIREEQKILAVQSMMAGEEAERARLARELHDSLGSMLSSMKLVMGKSPDDPTRDSLSGMVDRASTELRRIAHNLMPEALDRYGLVTAIEDMCDEWNANTDMEVTLQQYGMDEVVIPDSLKLSVFRMVQEMVTNATRHGKATETWIQLMQHADRLHITVEDNGTGFDSERVAGDVGRGMGLDNLRSRTTYWSGELDLASEPGGGTTISIEIPLDNQSITSQQT